MPVNIEIDLEDDLVVLKVSNPVTAAEVMTEYNKIFKLPGFHSAMNSLWDFRGLALRKIPLGEIRKLVVSLRGFVEQRGEGYKSGLVMGKQIDFHLINSYISIVKLIGNVDIKIFNQNMEEAKAWLQKAEL